LSDPTFTKELSAHFKELHDKLDAHHKAHNDDLAKLHERLDAMTAPKRVWTGALKK
jgi:hypothetical protein